MAKFPTDVAERSERATLSRAVDHLPMALSYKSTSSEYPEAAVTLIRRQPAAAQTQKSYKQLASNTHHPRKTTPKPSRTQRITAIT
jgi:hypothetical protein